MTEDTESLTRLTLVRVDLYDLLKVCGIESAGITAFHEDLLAVKRYVMALQATVGGGERMTLEQREFIAALGPYKLRPDGYIEDVNGVALAHCRPHEASEECEWDRALVAALNDVSDGRCDHRRFTDEGPMNRCVRPRGHEGEHK